MGSRFEDVTDEQLEKMYEDMAVDESILWNIEDSEMTERDRADFEEIMAEMEARGMFDEE